MCAHQASGWEISANVAPAWRVAASIPAATGLPISIGFCENYLPGTAEGKPLVGNGWGHDMEAQVFELFALIGATAHHRV